MKIFLYLIISIFIINYSCVNTKAIVGEVDGKRFEIDFKDLI